MQPTYEQIQELKKTVQETAMIPYQEQTSIIALCNEVIEAREIKKTARKMEGVLEMMRDFAYQLSSTETKFLSTESFERLKKAGEAFQELYKGNLS